MCVATKNWEGHRGCGGPTEERGTLAAHQTPRPETRATVWLWHQQGPIWEREGCCKTQTTS